MKSELLTDSSYVKMRIFKDKLTNPVFFCHREGRWHGWSNPDIKITLEDIMKFYLPHQLMQHKSIFVQTGRATYIILMTMQSQGGTTNETKCNYCPPHDMKTKWILLPSFWGFKDWDESKPFLFHHPALQLAFIPLFRLVFRLFIMIPISWWLSYHILPDTDELIEKKNRIMELFSYWHSNTNFHISLLIRLVRRDLNQKR